MLRTSFEALSAVWMTEIPSFAFRMACLPERALVLRFIATADPAASSAAFVTRSPDDTRASVLLS